MPIYRPKITTNCRNLTPIQHMLAATVNCCVAAYSLRVLEQADANYLSPGNI